MIKSLQEISLLDILPPNLMEDKKVYAAAKALDVNLKKVSENTKLVLHLPRLDELPDEVLDLLAWQYHVDFYRPEFKIEIKRNLIRESYFWHRIKGTPRAVEMLLESIFNEVKLEEWFEYPKGEGKPYRFRVTVGGFKQNVSKEYILQMIYAGKNLRSHLDWIKLDLTEKEYDGKEWIYPERNVLVHNVALANGYSNVREMAYPSIEDKKLGIEVQIYGEQSGVLEISADYSVKEGILLPNTTIMPVQSKIREVPTELQELMPCATKVVVPTYAAVEIGINNINRKTITMNIASVADEKIKIYQGNKTINSKRREMRQSGPEATSFTIFTGGWVNHSARREIESSAENLPEEMIKIKKPAYSSLSAGIYEEERKLKQIGLATIEDDSEKKYAKLKEKYIRKREIMTDIEALPQSLVDIKDNRVAMSTNTKINGRKTKEIVLNVPEEVKEQVKMAMEVKPDSRNRTIQAGITVDEKNEMVLATQQTSNANRKIKLDGEQTYKLMKEIESDVAGGLNAKVNIAAYEQKRKSVKIEQGIGTDDRFRVTTANWSNRSKKVEIKTETKLPKEISSIKAPAKAALAVNKRIRRQKIKKMEMSTPTERMRMTAVYFIGASRYIEIGLDEKQLEQIMNRKKAKMLSHVGLMKVGAVAVQ